MASFWDDLKDIFKSNSQREEDRRQKLQDALNREQSVVDLLDQLEKQYNYSLKPESKPDLDELFPKDSGLKEVSYTAATDEELQNSANAEIAAKKEAEKNKTVNKIYGEIEKLTGNSAEAKKKLEEEYKNISELYKSLAENSVNKSIKKGISRSSIASEAVNDISDNREASVSEAKGAFDNTIDKIDGEIEKLNRDKDAAMNELDLKYAAEIEKRIAALKNERDATVLKYEKYNNEVREKNIKYAQNRENDIEKFLRQQEQEKQKKEAALRDYEAKYGYSGEKQDNYAERYNVALDFYLSLSPDIAVQALEASPNMRYYLGNTYDKLKETLSNNTQGSKKYY